jgi:hypothetical protein
MLNERFQENKWPMVVYQFEFLENIYQILLNGNNIKICESA